MCNADASESALTTLLRAVEVFVNRAAPALSPAELGEHLIGLRHGIDLLELGFAIDAAVFAGTDEYDTQGSTTAVDWVRHHCHMSGHAAARSIAAGDQFERLPETVAAVEDGNIGFAHFTLIAGTARAFAAKMSRNPGSPGVDAADAPGEPGAIIGTVRFDERRLLDLALEHSVGRFGFDCSHARHTFDAATVLEEHVVSVERRRFEMIPCEGGAVAIRGLLDSVGGAVLRTALYPLGRPTGVGDERSLPRRLADALVEVAHHALDLDAVPETNGQGTRLQLTASVETVAGLEGAPGGDLVFAGAVPAATAQRLACDASIRRVLLGPDSAVTDVGRALRVPSAATRAALMARHSGCAWPGCDRPLAYTHAHHLVHWAHGGNTDLQNLVLLCYRHHWMVHEGGWQLVRADHDRTLAIPPTRTYHSWTRAPDGAVAG